MILIVGGFSAYFYFNQTREAAQPVATRLPSRIPAPVVEEEASPRHPVETASTSGTPDTMLPPEPLPALADSDPLFRDLLGGLFGPAVLDRYFRSEHFADRFVATVDALPRNELPPKLIPVQPTAGDMAVIERGPGYLLSSENYARYAPWVELAEGVDDAVLLDYYRRYYPLFQEAYQRLGHADAYFNDRLIAVLDHLLAVPEIAGPIELVKPEAFYLFADPALEGLSAGQKIMLRIGPENADTVKEKLRGLRTALAGPE